HRARQARRGRKARQARKEHRASKARQEPKARRAPKERRARRARRAPKDRRARRARRVRSVSRARRGRKVFKGQTGKVRSRDSGVCLDRSSYFLTCTETSPRESEGTQASRSVRRRQLGTIS